MAKESDAGASTATSPAAEVKKKKVKRKKTRNSGQRVREISGRLTLRLTPEEHQRLSVTTSRVPKPEKTVIGAKATAGSVEVNPYQDANLQGQLREDVFKDVEFTADQFTTQAEFVKGNGKGFSLAWIWPEIVENEAGKAYTADSRGVLVSLESVELELTNLVEDTIEVNGSAPMARIGNEGSVATRTAERFAVRLAPNKSMRVSAVYGDKSNLFTTVFATVKDEEGHGARAFRLYDFSCSYPNESAQSNTPYAADREVLKVSAKVRYVSAIQVLSGTITSIPVSTLTRTKTFLLGMIPASEVNYVDPVLIPAPTVTDVVGRRARGVGGKHIPGLDVKFSRSRRMLSKVDEEEDGVVVAREGAIKELLAYQTGDYWVLVRCLMADGTVSSVPFKWSGDHWAMLGNASVDMVIPAAAVEVIRVTQPQVQKIDWASLITTGIQVLEIVSMFL